MKIKKADGLNIVPFIDIMLVLLAIVLSISTFIAQGHIPLDLPKASSSQDPQNQEKRITISVNAQNKIFVGDQEVSIKLLRDTIATVDSATLIELKSDKESKFDVFIQILNLLKEKQHDNFAIFTQKD